MFYIFGSNQSISQQHPRCYQATNTDYTRISESEINPRLCNRTLESMSVITRTKSTLLFFSPYSLVLQSLQSLFSLKDLQELTGQTRSEYLKEIRNIKKIKKNQNFLVLAFGSFTSLHQLKRLVNIKSNSASFTILRPNNGLKLHTHKYLHFLEYSEIHINFFYIENVELQPTSQSVTMHSFIIQIARNCTLKQIRKYIASIQYTQVHKENVHL